MPKNLVIVESPTKAKTIQAMLGKDFVVESSFGHIRDLPKSEMGVDVEHGFVPKYIVPRDKSKRATALKKLAASAEQVYFATDEDREGEAISWHLQQLLNIPLEKAERIVFHEITEEAIKEALAHPRSIDAHLVDAQQARRILDRLVGYELSPLLWKKVAKGLSAGRVQSVALRLVVEREREIQAFIPQEYWTIEATLFPQGKDRVVIQAKLHSVEGKVFEKFAIANEQEAQTLLSALKDANYTVASVESKEAKRSAPAPYTTSTLQQDANRRLRLSPKQTMMLAQQLYEGISMGKGTTGLITYMRTDSVNLAEKFLGETKSYIAKNFDKAYQGPERRYATKSKLAQEAHEAIRPTSPFITPEEVSPFLNDQQLKLYDLIWRRTIGSQLPDAKYRATTVDIAASGTSYIFRATGQVTIFDGFTKVYTIDSEETLLPALSQNEPLGLETLSHLQHFTKPPARYSEAGLVKVLEEYGIGRPSTYAPTISTLLERNYVTKEERRLKPTDVAYLSNDLLVEHFPEIVDFNFTARMEDDLDSVATGEKEWVPLMKEFYDPFKRNLLLKEKEIKKSVVEEATDEVCEKCGKPMVIKMGRYGKFLACTGFPECKNAKPLETPAEAAGEEQATVDPCEKCGSPMILKQGRFGKFLACSKYPECKNIRNLKDKKTGLPCPECGQGEVITKRARKGGKTFYGCNRYPDCKFVSWTKPEGAA